MHSCWYFESVDLVRKLLLTSVVLVVEPNSKEQLWFGLVLSAGFAVVTIQTRPYRDVLPGIIQAAAQLQVLFTYISAGVLFYFPVELQATASQGAGLSEGDDAGSDQAHTLGLMLVLANCSAFAMLAAIVSYSAVKQHRALRALALTDGGALVELDPPSAGAKGFHLFLSHVWRHGQDQVGVIKSMLLVMLPSIRCFLDVDSLQDLAMLEAHVRDSDVVLILLTADYLSSRNCRRELTEAVRLSKPIVVVRETDPNHGLVTLAALREEAETLPICEDRDAAQSIVERVAEGKVLEWHRESHLKRETLKAIADAVIQAQRNGAGPEEHGGWQKSMKLLGYSGAATRKQHAGGPRIRLLDAYWEAAPTLCEQLASQLQAAGVDVVDGARGVGGGDAGDEGAGGAAAADGSRGDAEGAQVLILLSPEVLASAGAMRAICAELRTAPTGLAGAVRLYSTSVPFAFYLEHCPQDAKEAGLLGAMFEKWPESTALQGAAARNLVQQLQPTSGGGQRRRWRMAAVLGGWGGAGGRQAQYESSAKWEAGAQADAKEKDSVPGASARETVMSVKV